MASNSLYSGSQVLALSEENRGRRVKVLYQQIRNNNITLSTVAAPLPCLCVVVKGLQLHVCFGTLKA